jgi:cholesterol transport system auxiliary component
MTQRRLFHGPRLRAFLSVAMVLMLTAACGIIPTPRPAPQLYTLSPKSTFKSDLAPVDWQLGIETPSAPAGLSSARIAVTRKPLTLEYFAGAQWVDDAPAMVQRLLIESFENSNRIVGVGRLAVALRSDYVLQPELREFQAEYRDGGSAPKIRVRINAKLIKMPERRIVASDTFERIVDAPDNRMPVIVKTFDQALGKVMRDLVVWTLNVRR